ncbi:MAG: M28 family peptidase [Gemmatimonadetes bacterium]|nr:M28 family peptidase [Gemmatimonadota bacterium]
MNSLLGSVLVALLGFMVACQNAGGDVPGTESLAQRAERPSFRAAEAFAHLERQVAFGPRVPGTAGHGAQLEWMRQFLDERADTVIEQPFTHRTAAGDVLRMTNVFARFRPEATRRILLLAHWDTRPAADQDPDPANRRLPVPGANDGASGVAVLLELADMFARQLPPIGVDILLTDGEDYGPDTEDMFLGARYFAANLPGGYRPLYGVLLDMVANRNPRFPIEGYSNRYAPDVARRVWEVARQLGYADVFPAQVGPTVQDDHVPLNQAGIRTINIIDMEYPYWHTVRDVPENTSPETLRIVGEVVAELVYRGG